MAWPLMQHTNPQQSRSLHQGGPTGLTFDIQGATHSHTTPTLGGNKYNMNK